MKVIISFILLALSSIIHADVKLAVAPYLADESDSHGAVIEISGKGSFLWKADINLSQNFAGPSVAAGFPLGDFKFFVGYHDMIRHEKQDGFVDVAGVLVFDPDSDAQGDGAYLEARYKKFFVRYTDYEIDYTLRGRRTVLVNGVPTGFETIETRTLDGYVTWVGFNFPFK